MWFGPGKRLGKVDPGKDALQGPMIRFIVNMSLTINQ